jgi:hypothetical protein
MRTEIYIENQRLDLYKDISAEFTYNIDDVKDFSSRNTNFSKTIVIPGNANNNKLFGHIFEFGSGNFYNPNGDNVGYNYNAAKSASCLVYVDKIQIFKGVIRLLEIVLDGGIEYECAVFGELGGFVGAVGNRKLEDLDFSVYNHNWTRDNVVNSWNQASGITASGMGYYYPLIDYGQVSADKINYSIRAFRPALFVREYMTKIIEEAGYTWESQFFDSNIFKRLIVPNNQKLLSTSSTQQLAAAGLYPLSLYTSISTQTFIVNWDTPTKLGGFSFDGVSEFLYTTASLTATASIYVYGGQNVPDLESALTQLEYYKNGALQSTHFVAQDREDEINRFIEVPITVALNDYIEFKLKFSGVTDFVSLTLQQYSIEINTSSVVDTPLALGELIEMNKTTPRGIFQKDFFASIVKMFNLYVTESTEKFKHLIIEPYIDYYLSGSSFLQVNALNELLLVNDSDLLLLDDAAANYVDWTLKVDRSKPLRLKPMSELNGRYFEYKYKSDSDFYNEGYTKKYAQGYADYIEDTGFEFANDKQTAELIFASSPLVGYAGKDKIATAIYKKSNTQNTTSEDYMDSIIRIMQVRKINAVDNWYIQDINGTNLGVALSSYGYAGHLDDPDVPTADINFGAPKEIYFTLVTPYPSANIFNAFWSDYVAEITDKDSKLLTCNIRLTDADIYNLDFSKLIWIDGSLWRLNKVIDYNPMTPDTTKCEFLKVIETSYA